MPDHVQLLVRIGRVIKFRDEEIDYTDEVVLTDQVLQAVRKKHRLAPINTVNETRHANPRCPVRGYHSGQFLYSLGRLRQLIKLRLQKRLDLGAKGIPISEFPYAVD